MEKYEIAIYIIITVFLHLAVLWALQKKPKKSLKGRNVIVTGGSAGIGLHVAINCAKLGANVVIIARNENLLSMI